MKLKRIAMKGFMRFKNSVEVDFPQNQVTLITGENGAGKTTILDALCISLYGKTFRTSGRATSGYLGINDLVNHACDKAVIRVEFENHGHNYVVNRTITATGSNGEIFEDGDSKALGPKVYSYVRARAIGLDWEGFRKSTIVLQGEMSSLTDLDPQPRKDAFIKLFGLDRYFEYEKLAQKKADDRENEISTFGMANDVLRVDIKKIPKTQQEVRRLSHLISSLQRRTAKLTESVAQKKQRKDSLEGDYNQSIELKTRIEGLTDQVDKGNASLMTLQEERRGLLALKKQFPKLKKSYDEYVSLDEGLSKLKPIKTKYDGLGQTLLTLRNNLGSKQTQYSGVLNDKKQTQNYIKELRKQIPTQKMIAKATTSLNKARAQEITLSGKIATLRSEIKQIAASIKDLKAKMEQVKGQEECPICLQKITDPQQILNHYLNEINKLKEEDKGKQAKLLLTTKGLALKSKQIIELAANEQELLGKAAKKSELTKEEKRLSGFEDKRKALLSEIITLKLGINQKLKEQKQLEFSPVAFSKIDERLALLRREKTVEKFSNAETEIRRIPTVAQAIGDAGKHVTELEGDRSGLQKQRQKLGRVETLYSTAKVQFDIASKLLAESDKSLATQQANKENQESLLAELKDKKRTLRDNEKKIGQLKLEIITMGELKDIFKNIPENILRRLRPFIEKEGTDIINELSNGKITALNIEEGNLNVAATMNGEIRPIQYFSGGEKTRINMALRVAVARILSKLPQTEEHSFVTMQTLFIDEGDFGNLDEQGIRESISVIRNLTKEFDRVILVSHVAEIREIFHGYTIEAQKIGVEESSIKAVETIEAV